MQDASRATRAIRMERKCDRSPLITINDDLKRASITHLPLFLFFYSFSFPPFFDLYFVLPFFLLLLAFSFIVFTYTHTNIYIHTCAGIFPRRFTLAGIDDARARVVLRRRGKIYYHGPRGRGIIEQFVLRYRFNSIAPFLCPFFRAETFIFFIFHSIDAIYYATILCFMK